MCSEDLVLENCLSALRSRFVVFFFFSFFFFLFFLGFFFFCGVVALVFYFIFGGFVLMTELFETIALSVSWSLFFCFDSPFVGRFPLASSLGNRYVLLSSLPRRGSLASLATAHFFFC